MTDLPVLAVKQETERTFYTVAEAAHLLDVSPATIWRWIEAGRLPAFRVGPRRIRIRKDDVHHVIQPARRTVTAIPEKAKHPDIFAHYDPVRARVALVESAGALARVDRQVLRADLRAQRGQDSPGRPA